MSENYLVRILKGRGSNDPPEVKKVDVPLQSKPEPDQPETESGPEPKLPEPVKLDDLKAQERQARREVKARFKEDRRLAKEAKLQARTERHLAREAKAKKNAEIRTRRQTKIAKALPMPTRFLCVSSAVQARVNDLERLGCDQPLAAEYSKAGFKLLDLPSAMSGHFEDEAREWAQGDSFDAWRACKRADWLAWACASKAGYGYPGLWLASSDCLSQALAVSRDIPDEVRKFCGSILRDLERFVAGYRRRQADLGLLDELRQLAQKFLRNVETKKAGFLVKIAEALVALLSLEGEVHPAVDTIVRSAVILAQALPERLTVPDSWRPGQKDREQTWKVEGRPRAEVRAKLEFLAPLVRARIPVALEP